MAEDETKKDETPEETPQDETPQDEAPEAAGPVAEEAPGEELGSSPEAEQAEPAESEGRGTDAAASPDPLSAPPAEDESAGDDLPWKERRRLEKSRRPHTPRPQQSAEERVAEREARRKRKAAERRKERSAARAKKDGKGTGTPVAEHEANAAKVRQGIVVSDKAEKSITVRIDFVRRHPTYEKVVRNTRTLHAHDERNEAGEGDTVRVVETRPMSKTKRWRLVEVVEKAR